MALSVAFILRDTCQLQHMESGIRRAVLSGVDVLICFPPGLTGIQAIVWALATISHVSTVSTRTLAPAIRLPALTIRARPSAIHLIGIAVGTITPVIPPFTIIRCRMAATIYPTPVSVRALVISIKIPSPCLLALATIIGIPAIRVRAPVSTIRIPMSCVRALVMFIVMPPCCVRTLVAMSGTTILVTVIAVTPV